VPVIAVINRKGGSGKSTVATHVAASYARAGERVMLGDVDRQQSSRSWLRRRGKLDAAQAPPIQGWIVDKLSVARPPAGVSHLVLDTPGGLTGFDLARLVMWCDAILIPVCDSRFDRESAAACHEELRALPRVAGGRCRVGVLGMRVDRRTRGHASLQAWAAENGMDWLGSLRDTQLYVTCADRGLTVFDLPAAKGAADVEEWQPVLAWLARAAAALPARTADGAAAVRTASAAASSAAASIRVPAKATRAISPAPPIRSSADVTRDGPVSLSTPSTLEADVSELELTGVPKPGLLSALRRLWRR
jgi:chromosome partitioning protein